MITIIWLVAPKLLPMMTVMMGTWAHATLAIIFAWARSVHACADKSPVDIESINPAWRNRSRSLVRAMYMHSRRMRLCYYMYTRIFTSMYVYEHVCTCLSAHVFLVHTCTHGYGLIHVCTHVYTCVLSSKWLYVTVYAFTCLYAYVRVWT